MGQEYLPGDTPQQRLQDLMKEYKITQAELASKIGVTESSISRFLNGTKNKLTIEQIISIARIFNVSSDFLLCLTNVPDKKWSYIKKKYKLNMPFLRLAYPAKASAFSSNAA